MAHTGDTTGQPTSLPHAFTSGTLYDPGAWNMDTSASSHLNNLVISLSENFNTCMYPSISVGDGHSIPVTNTSHSILPTPFKSLHLIHVLIPPHIVKNLIFVRQFVRDNNCTIEFDAFGFSVKDFMTYRHTWHQRLGHPGREVLRHLVSNNFISCNKEKPPVLCHACQLGKHVRLPFVSSNTVVTSCFDIIHSDVWTSPIPSLSGCLCYPHLHTNHKIEPRATPSIYLGQASNHCGYRCLDLKTNKIIISRHVTFDETVFPYGSTQPALPPTYTFLDDIPDIIPPAIPTNPAVQLPPEPITQIHNTPIQQHPDAAQLPTTPQQLSPAQVQTTENQAHSPPSSTSVVQQQTPTLTQLAATQNEPVAQSPIIIPDPPENPNLVSVHPMVTRFHVGTNRPTKRLNLHVSLVSPLPKSYRDAFSDPNWQNAMREEYHALIKNKTWTLVPRPPDTNIVRCMWLFRHKYLVDGTLSRYKARLVANDSTQLEGVDGTDTAYLLLYVDDIVLTTSSKSLLQQIIRSLHQEFAMTNLSPLNYFLGISITRDSPGLFLSQKKYAIELLDRAYTDHCSLQYLTFTRPDISYAVQQVCLYMHDPREPHFSALKRILHYVRGTLDYGLQLFSSSNTDLVAYSDVDWAGCPTTRCSTFGYYVFLGNNLLSWSSKRQPMLSHSSAGVEYRGVANAVTET
ncbi:ribonuclease H-like domain-containing protein [Tanacetum coccineum]